MIDHEESECQMCDAPFESGPNKLPSRYFYPNEKVEEILVCDVCYSLGNNPASRNDTVKKNHLVEAVRLILDEIRALK